MHARARLSLGVFAILSASATAQNTPDRLREGSVAALTASFGTASIVATHADFSTRGFGFGPSDGTFGATVAQGKYTFFASASSSSACPNKPGNTPGKQGTFSITGTLDQVTGGDGCKALFTLGAAPKPWIFDRDYGGGGPVIPFISGSTTGLLMTYHGEVHWKAPSGDGLCDNVPCFYGSLGLAVSTDGGVTFIPVGQIIQPYESLPTFMGGGKNLPVGYGPMVVADANGKPIATPVTNPQGAYVYVFFEDVDPQGTGICANGACLAVARAPLTDLLAAALPPSGSPSAVASVFKKYDSSATNPWSAAGTSGTPDESGMSGHFTPLFNDEHGQAPTVMYDNTVGAYLLAYLSTNTIRLRTSTDLIHWSLPVTTYSPQAGRTLQYPSLIGEGSDPLIGGAAPRLYYSSFATFPDWSSALFETVPINLTLKRHRAVRH
jgi:hypothetical protein